MLARYDNQVTSRLFIETSKKNGADSYQDGILEVDFRLWLSFLFCPSDWMEGL